MTQKLTMFPRAGIKRGHLGHKCMVAALVGGGRYGMAHHFPPLFLLLEGSLGMSSRGENKVNPTLSFVLHSCSFFFFLDYWEQEGGQDGWPPLLSFQIAIGHWALRGWCKFRDCKSRKNLRDLWKHQEVLRGGEDRGEMRFLARGQCFSTNNERLDRASCLC